MRRTATPQAYLAESYDDGIREQEFSVPISRESVASMVSDAQNVTDLDELLTRYQHLCILAPDRSKTALRGDEIVSVVRVTDHAEEGRLSFQDFVQNASGLELFGLDAARWQFETFGESQTIGTLAGELAALGVKQSLPITGDHAQLRLSFSEFWKHFAGIPGHFGGIRYTKRAFLIRWDDDGLTTLARTFDHRAIGPKTKRILPFSSLKESLDELCNESIISCDLADSVAHTESLHLRDYSFREFLFALPFPDDMKAKIPAIAYAKTLFDGIGAVDSVAPRESILFFLNVLCENSHSSLLEAKIGSLSNHVTFSMFVSFLLHPEVARLFNMADGIVAHHHKDEHDIGVLYEAFRIYCHNDRNTISPRNLLRLLQRQEIVVATDIRTIVKKIHNDTHPHDRTFSEYLELLTGIQWQLAEEAKETFERLPQTKSFHVDGNVDQVSRNHSSSRVDFHEYYKNYLAKTRPQPDAKRDRATSQTQIISTIQDVFKKMDPKGTGTISSVDQQALSKLVRGKWTSKDMLQLDKDQRLYSLRDIILMETGLDAPYTNDACILFESCKRDVHRKVVGTEVSAKARGSLKLEIEGLLDKRPDGKLTFGDIFHTFGRVTSTDHLTIDDMQMLYELFRHFDKDSNGTISRDELAEIFSNVARGKKMQESFIDERMKEVDKNVDGVITFSEYICLQLGLSIDRIDEIKASFDTFPADALYLIKSSDVAATCSTLSDQDKIPFQVFHDVSQCLQDETINFATYFTVMHKSSIRPFVHFIEFQKTSADFLSTLVATRPTLMQHAAKDEEVVVTPQEEEEIVVAKTIVWDTQLDVQEQRTKHLMEEPVLGSIEVLDSTEDGMTIARPHLLMSRNPNGHESMVVQEQVMEQKVYTTEEIYETITTKERVTREKTFPVTLDDISLLYSMFRQADLDSSGVIDQDEFGRLLKALEKDGTLTPAFVEDRLREIDANEDGFVSFAELVEMHTGHLIEDLNILKVNYDSFPRTRDSKIPSAILRTAVERAQKLAIAGGASVDTAAVAMELDEKLSLQSTTGPVKRSASSSNLKGDVQYIDFRQYVDLLLTVAFQPLRSDVEHVVIEQVQPAKASTGTKKSMSNLTDIYLDFGRLDIDKRGSLKREDAFPDQKPSKTKSHVRVSFSEYVGTVTGAKVNGLDTIKRNFETFSQVRPGWIATDEARLVVDDLISRKILGSDARVRLQELNDANGLLGFREFFTFLQIRSVMNHAGKIVKSDIQEVPASRTESTTRIVTSTTKTIIPCNSKAKLKEIGVMYRMFCSLDKDGSGTITAVELEGAMRKLLKGKRIPEAYVEQQMKKADRNRDGQVSFVEYVTMHSGAEVIGLDEIKANFETFTRDKKGNLKTSEVLDVCRQLVADGQISQSIMDSKIMMMDRDKDGSISFEEYFFAVFSPDMADYSGLIRKDTEIVDKDEFAPSLEQSVEEFKELTDQNVEGQEGDMSIVEVVQPASIEHIEVVTETVVIETVVTETVEIIEETEPYPMKLEDLSLLYSLFRQIDFDGSGFIGKIEFMKLLGKMEKEKHLTSAFINTRLQQVDLDSDGKVSFSEFVAMHTGHLIPELDKLKKNYDSFPRDKLNQIPSILFKRAFDRALQQAAISGVVTDIQMVYLEIDKFIQDKQVVSFYQFVRFFESPVFGDLLPFVHHGSRRL